ncbi:serine/threonine-protein phosphatase 2A regulatory subunit B'' subunit alpha-like isoform X1 [Paramormyrops kingsleyae]|uniref:serine/threonine-protein phosphatase 2A regulatory subunit B'' subunit alpha-like isoform X1 n=2 Tax=Paramormyrops kingsleyae TaxID=1676925 RepID=UPI003B976543
MAATYRLVVSSVSHYHSVLVDQRHPQVVHYCEGPCSLLMHGLECTAAHRGLCFEPVDPVLTGSKEFVSEATTLKTAGSNLRHQRPVNGEKNRRNLPRTVPGLKRGSSVHTPFSLKDITRDAINLASGKVKEFSFNQMPLQTGRKLRLDPLGQRYNDVDFTGRRFCENDENLPPFTHLPMTLPEGLQKEIPQNTSPEQHSSITITSLPDMSIEENLMAQILQLTKVDAGTSGEDIRSCLNILLKCSNDLKKCTDIIRQCIKRKALVEGRGNHENEIIYRTVVDQLSRHLKKWPFGFEHELPGAQEHSDWSRLVSTLHGFQQSPLCSIIDHEQPPRYEDVVCSQSSIQTVYPNLSLHEAQEATGVPCSNENSVQGPHCLPFQVPPSENGAQHHIGVSSLAATLDCNVSSITVENHEKPGELLYFDKEPHDLQVMDNKIQEAGNSLLDSVGFAAKALIQQEDLTTHASTCEAEIPQNTWEKTMVVMDTEQPHSEGPCDTCQGTEGVRSPTPSCRGASSDKTDEMPVDSEHHDIDKEPRFRNYGQQTDNLQRTTSDSKKLAGGGTLQEAPAEPEGLPEAPAGGQTSHDEEMKDQDDALLLQILEQIESFAQGPSEGGVAISSGTGTPTQEPESTKPLQDTVFITVGTDKVNPLPPEATGEEHKSVEIQQDPEVMKSDENTRPLPHTAPPAGEVTRGIIPSFNFASGVPMALGTDLDLTKAQIEVVFTELGEQRATMREMGKITKACGYPLYWKAPLFHSAGGGKTGSVSASSLMETWRKLSLRCHDDSSKFVYLLSKPDYTYVEQEDFVFLLQDIVNSHPGLTFLKDAPEFHSRYITTVIQRIFYTVNRSWTGRITAHELRRSNFLETLAALEEESDINQVTDYFSYEHFYVIYCKFWELDTDHNLLIDHRDLAKYNYHASSERIVERLFSGAVSRGSSGQSKHRMSYAEFVWFLISEEDKKTPTSVEYWFRCMDLDGDGVLSMYELEHFYQEQSHRLEAMGVDPLPFHDLMCQVLDLVRPQRPGMITLQDLKRCGMAHVFYDTFFSLEKYLEHEQRDPFAIHKEVERAGREVSDWCRFAAEEYEVLVAEESESEHLEDESSEGDTESETVAVSLETASDAPEPVTSD